MPGFTMSVQIAAAPEVVWRFVSDPSRYPEWVDPTDRMVDVPAGEMRSGYVYKEYGGIPPFKANSTWTVTEFDPPRRQVHIGDDGSMRFHLDNILEPRDGGTLFTQKLRMSPRPWIAPVAYLTWPLFMKKRANASIRKTQENLKRLMESGKAP